MADKNRVPDPPKRPVQAPKAYRPERNPRRSQLIFIVIAVLIVLAAAAVAVGFIMSGRDGGNTGSVAGGTCQKQTFDALEARHVQELPEDYEYNSTPATSGLHNSQTAIWNLYDSSVPQINYVHNLEHGGVIVQYGSGISAETVAEIADWYDDDTRGLIVAPIAAEMEEEDAALAGQIVLTSWTHMMRCSAFNEGAFDDFIDDYRGPQGDAPEKFPLDVLRQGQG